MAAANNEFFEALSMLEHERGINFFVWFKCG